MGISVSNFSNQTPVNTNFITEKDEESTFDNAYGMDLNNDGAIDIQDGQSELDAYQAWADQPVEIGGQKIANPDYDPEAPEGSDNKPFDSWGDYMQRNFTPGTAEYDALPQNYKDLMGAIGTSKNLTQSLNELTGTEDYGDARLAEMLDVDGSGQLTQEEIDTVLDADGNFDETKLNEILENFDPGAVGAATLEGELDELGEMTTDELKEAVALLEGAEVDEEGNPTGFPTPLNEAALNDTITNTHNRLNEINTALEAGEAILGADGTTELTDDEIAAEIAELEETDTAAMAVHHAWNSIVDDNGFVTSFDDSIETAFPDGVNFAELAEEDRAESTYEARVNSLVEPTETEETEGVSTTEERQAELTEIDEFDIEEFDATVSDLDANEDNQVTREEFEAAVKTAAERSDLLAQIIEDAENNFDENGEYIGDDDSIINEDGTPVTQAQIETELDGLEASEADYLRINAFFDFAANDDGVLNRDGIFEAFGNGTFNPADIDLADFNLAAEMYDEMVARLLAG